MISFFKINDAGSSSFQHATQSKNEYSKSFDDEKSVEDQKEVKKTFEELVNDAENNTDTESFGVDINLKSDEKDDQDNDFEKY